MLPSVSHSASKKPTTAAIAVYLFSTSNQHSSQVCSPAMSAQSICACQSRCRVNPPCVTLRRLSLRLSLPIGTASGPVGIDEDLSRKELGLSADTIVSRCQGSILRSRYAALLSARAQLAHRLLDRHEDMIRANGLDQARAVGLGLCPLIRQPVKCDDDVRGSKFGDGPSQDLRSSIVDVDDAVGFDDQCFTGTRGAAMADLI